MLTSINNTYRMEESHGVGELTDIVTSPSDPVLSCITLRSCNIIGNLQSCQRKNKADMGAIWALNPEVI